MNSEIRVYLVARQPLYRQGLYAIFAVERGIEIVGEADCFSQAAPTLLTARADVILVEWPDAEDEWPAMIENGPTLVALASQQSAQMLYSAMAAGAVGYLSKEVGIDVLLAAVRQAADGKSFWTLEQLNLLLGWQETVWRRWQKLTPREREVIRLMVRGVGSTRALAEQLGVAERTVEKHISAILGKLGVESRLEVVVWVIRNGLLALVEAKK